MKDRTVETHTTRDSPPAALQFSPSRRARPIKLHRVRAIFVSLLLACVAVTTSGRPKNEPAADAWQPASRYLAQRRATYKRVSRTSRYLTMRDGVKIAVDLNLPEGLKEGEKIPTIIRQTRYFRSHDMGWLLRFLLRNLPSPQKLFVTQGYAWVDLDVRGTGASFGRWAYSWSPDEIRDGGEVVDWIVNQPWSNGKVGATGISYDGGSAEFLLANKHPAVKASAPQFTLFDAYGDIAYPGGIHLNSFTRVWAALDRMLDNDLVPRITALMPVLVRSSYHGVRPVDSDRDGSMLAQAIREHVKNLDVDAMALQITYRDDAPTPAGVSIDTSSPFSHAAEINDSGGAIYTWDGWFDGGFQNAAIKRYLTLKNPAKLIIGPWNHGGWSDDSPFNHSHKSAFKIHAELLRFLDYHLKGINNGIMEEKPILYFTMGEEKWKSAAAWPPPGTQSVSFYLDAGRRLSTAKPNLAHASDSYLVDLNAGTGYTSRWDLGATVIYPDRRAADEKLLHYSSAPLEADTEVTGHPIVTLFVSSTANDGEFFAYLEDVDPKGRVTYVTEGELRGIHRKISSEPPPYRQIGPYHSFKRRDAMPLLPGEITELTFEILPTSYLFKRGHSIRLALAGADRDHFALLPGPPPTLRFYRDSAHASRINLPVMTR